MKTIKFTIRCVGRFSELEYNNVIQVPVHADTSELIEMIVELYENITTEIYDVQYEIEEDSVDWTTVIQSTIVGPNSANGDNSLLINSPSKLRYILKKNQHVLENSVCYLKGEKNHGVLSQYYYFDDVHYMLVNEGVDYYDATEDSINRLYKYLTGVEE